MPEEETKELESITLEAVHTRTLEAVHVVKPGAETSEHEETKSAGRWGVIMMILGFLTTTVAQLLESVDLSDDSKIGIIAGAVLAIAGVAQKTLTSLGYTKSRTDVKVAASSGVK